MNESLNIDDYSGLSGPMRRRRNRNKFHSNGIRKNIRRGGQSRTGNFMMRLLV